jgi:hypothetical protein
MSKIRLAYTVAAVGLSVAFVALLIAMMLDLTAPNPHYTGRGMLGAGARALFVGAMAVGAWAARSKAPKA